MAWNHDDVGPRRSRDELLGEVVRRGEGIRRRRAATGLAGGIALLLVVAGVAAVVGPGGDPATQVAAGGPTTSLVQRLQANAAGGTTAVDAPATTTVEPQPTFATTPPQAVASTVPTVPGTTSPAPTATVPTTIPGAIDPAPLQPRCSPAQMEATLTFAQATYRAGEQAVGDAVLRNRSGAPCYYYSYTQSQEFRNGAGSPVSPGAALIADAFADTAFAAGHTMTASASWDLRLCRSDPSCPPAPPGTYSGSVSWSFDGPAVVASATFQVAP